MSEVINSAETVGATLSYLATVVQSADVIDRAHEEEEIEPWQVVMTSMGTRNKALLTPFYSGFPFVHNLTTRIERARAYVRSMPEAVIKLTRDESTRRIASVTLRFLSEVPASDLIESAWVYRLSPEIAVSTTWDVIKQIADEPEAGAPVPNRSGLVDLADNRLYGSHKWTISHPHPSDLITSVLHQNVVETAFYTF